MPVNKRPMIRIHNVETNEIVDREMNDEEFAIHQAEEAKFEAGRIAKEEAAVAKAALLERLGITEAEAQLLLK